ncbi:MULTISPECIES: hypothetical protein [Methylobacterium]|uniref:hypothetical protein n=1 Tax=Methylobacterium TaxID=407 RepID=UPI00104ABADB|nr:MULTISPECIES: hypothetical protein [Methylobacterium]MDR7038171.1 hypothetical protein [Methylobacterium sp. BE186]
MSGIDVVFIASGSNLEAVGTTSRRTIVFVPGQPIPRIGECVILAFGADARRWQVQDVAHVFENDSHGVAVKLIAPVD